LWRNPRQVSLLFFASLPSGASLRRSVWRSVVRLSAAGEGVFTDRAGGPQGVFSGGRHLFFKNLLSRSKSKAYNFTFFANRGFPRFRDPLIRVRIPHILRYPPAYPQVCVESGQNLPRRHPIQGRESPPDSSDSGESPADSPEPGESPPPKRERAAGRTGGSSSLYMVRDQRPRRANTGSRRASSPRMTAMYMRGSSWKPFTSMMKCSAPRRTAT